MQNENVNTFQWLSNFFVTRQEHDDVVKELSLMRMEVDNMKKNIQDENNILLKKLTKVKKEHLYVEETVVDLYDVMSNMTLNMEKNVQRQITSFTNEFLVAQSSFLKGKLETHLDTCKMMIEYTINGDGYEPVRSEENENMDGETEENDENENMDGETEENYENYEKNERENLVAIKQESEHDDIEDSVSYIALVKIAYNLNDYDDWTKLRVIDGTTNALLKTLVQKRQYIISSDKLTKKKRAIHVYKEYADEFIHELQSLYPSVWLGTCKIHSFANDI